MTYAITVQQPWGWAIIHNSKNVENRTNFGLWRRAQGLTIAIHAGQRWSDRGERIVGQHVDRPLAPHYTAMHTGAIIGTAYVDEVHYADTDCDPDQCAAWGENAYREHDGRNRTDIVHLLLERRRPLPEPIPCRGQLGLWRVPHHISRQLEMVGAR